MDTAVQDTLRVHFTNKELALVVAFLDRGFSPSGQIVVGSIFLFAQEAGKSVEEVLKACEAEWERNWQSQHPDIKGDPDASGGAGIQNRASLQNIYSALGFPSPLVIPQKALTVTTKNSTYRLGEADDEGRRTVSRDGAPIEFTRCKIVSLGLGKRMELQRLDGPDLKGWSTSPVRSIK